MAARAGQLRPGRLPPAGSAGSAGSVRRAAPVRGPGPVRRRRRLRGRLHGRGQARARLRRRGRRRLRRRPWRPPGPSSRPPGQPWRRPRRPPLQAQVPLDRAAGRAAGHRRPARGRRRLRLQLLHEQVPSGRLLRGRHGLRRGPGHRGRQRDHPRAETSQARRRRQLPRVRPGGRAQLELVRPAARLLRDARAHAGVAGLRAADQPEEPGKGHGDDPGGLAGESGRGLARRQVRRLAQRLRQGARAPGLARPARLGGRQARGLPVPRDLHGPAARNRPRRAQGHGPAVRPGGHPGEPGRGGQAGAPQPGPGDHHGQPGASRGRPAVGLPEDRPGHLQPAGAGHAAATGQHGALRPEQVRHPRQRRRAQQPVAVQHLPAQGPDARPDRQPGERGHPGRPAPGRKTGETRFTSSLAQFEQFRQELQKYLGKG